MNIGKEKVATDFSKIFDLINQGGYSGNVVLEYEGKEDPFVKVPILLEELKKLAVEAR